MMSDPLSGLDRWCHGLQFPRYLVDLIEGNAARLRPGAGRPRLALKGILGAEGAGFDSLELFHLAIAVADALQAPGSGDAAALQQLDDLPGWIAAARRAVPTSRAVGFRTSGSTGDPRLVIHPMESLAQEIGELAALLRNRTRIVSLVPAHHIYGFLFTVLLPQKLDIPVVDARGLLPVNVAEMARPGDLIVGLPHFWDAGGSAVWGTEVEGVCSGGACAAGTADALKAAGLGRLVEIYGSTETGGIGWRDSGQVPYRLLPGWACETDGSVVKLVSGKARSFPLPDRVDWHGPDRLVPAGRLDDAVQIGATNVYPQRTRAVLLEHPAVAAAAVRKMSAAEGDRLKAYIVPAAEMADPAALRAELESWAAARLQPAEMPRAFSFGPRLPINAMGKDADWPVA